MIHNRGFFTQVCMEYLSAIPSYTHLEHKWHLVAMFLPIHWRPNQPKEVIWLSVRPLFLHVIHFPTCSLQETDQGVFEKNENESFM